MMKASLAKPKTAAMTLSATSLLVFSLLNVGVAFAEGGIEPGASALTDSGFPLLADSRDERRVYDRDRPRSKERDRFKADDRDRDRSKTDRRDRDRSKTDRRDRDRFKVDNRDHDRRWDGDKRRIRNEPKVYRERERHEYRTPRYAPHTLHYNPPPRVVVVPRHSHPRERIIIRRPFRYYPRHKHYHLDHDIWGLLAFTAITLSILDNLNDAQQRQHELALYNATAVPLGETIYWHEGSASGSVTPIQEGTSSSGRYCREFQHEVDIGGSTEVLYGTACQNDDGSWEIVQ